MGYSNSNNLSLWSIKKYVKVDFYIHFFCYNKVGDNMKRLSYNIFSRYREVLMGLAIISILIFHYTEDCSLININFNGFVKYYKTYIGSSGVDIFLLLSGLGLYYSYSKNNNLKDFYIKRIKRVLVPYFIIAIPVYIWYDLIYLSDGILSLLKNLFFVTLFTNNNILFWYIFFIIICYLIFPLIFKFIQRDNSYRGTFKISLIITILLIGIYFIYKYYPGLFNNYNIMLLRFIPFILGILLGKLSYRSTRIEYSFILFILGIGMVVLIRRNLIYNRVFLFIFLLSIFFWIIYFLDYLKNKDNIFVKFFSFFGKYSLEIYLVHVAIRKIIKSYGYPTYKFGYYLLFILVSIIVSILFNKLIKKLLRIKN